MRTVDILGVPVACLDQDTLFAQALTWALPTVSAGVDESQPAAFAPQLVDRRTIFYANAHSLNMAQEIASLRAVLAKADLVYADGIGVVWAARFLHGVRLAKLTGRAWIFPFCRLAAQRDLRLFLLGGRPGVAHRAADRLQERFPGLQVVGTHDGCLPAVGLEDVLDQVNQARPHLLLVGLGTPLQEEWIASHRHEIRAPLCWAVGALFDYLAGLERPVPTWLNFLGLEWFWRLLQDPRGKWKRYLLGNPIFLWRVLRAAPRFPPFH